MLNEDEEKEVIFETMLMSDLHLEYSDANIPEFDVVAPNLILAGDIGRPDIPSLTYFLLKQSQRFENIFYVSGNHCFYDGIYQKRLQQLEELNNLHPHIHFLQSSSFLLPHKVRILGTTLWSNIPSEKKQLISESLIDYRCIFIEENNKIRSITVDDTNEWHSNEYQWLIKQMNESREKDEHVIIITHHCPSRVNTCLKEDEDAGLEHAYVNDLHHLFQHPVRLWCYGHTHRSTNFILNSTRIISNQLGTQGESCGFKPNMKITLWSDGSSQVNS